MSLGNTNIHQKGDIPEITKLPNGRIRVIRRFQKFTREDVDNSNLGSLMGDFGDLDTTGEEIAGQGYTDCRLISVEVDNRFNALSNAENAVLIKTYETLTDTFVETVDPTVTFSESGLKEITKIYRAVSGTTSSNTIGTTTLASGEILATSSIKDDTAFAELTEVYRESGIRNVTVERDSDSQTVSVECVELSSTEVSSALSSLIGDHELATERTQNKDGFEVNIYTYKIDDLTTLETTSDDLNFVRKIELSASNFDFGTINSTSLVFDSDTYTLRKEEVNNTGIIKKRSRIFALYDSASFPANTLFEIDKTYGIAIPVARQIVPSATASGTISETEAIQIEPVDSFRSLSYKILASDVASNLPQQVWYEKRNVSIFPDELVSATIIGTESPVFVANYKEAPKVGLKARITRKFSWGAPDNNDTVSTTSYHPQPFSGAMEVEVTRNSTSETASTSTNVSGGTNTSNSDSSSETTSRSTGSSTSSSTTNSTVTNSGSNESTTTTTGSNSSDSTTNSTSNGTNNSTTNSNSTGNSTSNSSTNSSSNSNGGSNVSSSSSANGTSSSSSNSSGSGSSSSQVTSSGTASSNRNIQSDMVQDVAMMGTDTVDAGTSTRTTRSQMDAVPTPADPARHVNVEGIQSTTQFSKTNQGNNITSGVSSQSNTSQANSTSNQSGTSNSSNNSTTNTSSSSNTSSQSNSNSFNNTNASNSGNSSNTSNSTINSNSTSNGTNNSTVNSTSTTEGTNTSTSTSSGENTSDSTNTSEGQSTSNTTTNSSTIGRSTTTSSGNNNNTSNSTSTSKNTSKSIISVNVRPSLRAQKTVTFGNKSVVIPATSPTSITRNQYIEIERSASHWKYNIWVEQIVEVYLPA